MSGTGSGTGTGTHCPPDLVTGTGSFEGRPALQSGRIVDTLVIDDVSYPVVFVSSDKCERDTSEQMYGRLVDWQVVGSGLPGLDNVGTVTLPVYNVADKCCEYPMTSPTGTGSVWDMVFINVPCFLQPISERLIIRASSTFDCTRLQCYNSLGPGGEIQPHYHESILTYDYGSDSWKGCLDRLCVELKCSGGSGGGSLMLSILPESCHAVILEQQAPICDWPLHLSVTDIEVGGECCDCWHLVPPGTAEILESRVNLDIYGFCTRTKAARFVDKIRYTPEGGSSPVTIDVYEPSTDACSDPPCQKSLCCNDWSVCTMVITFAALGGCSCLDGQSYRLYQGGGGGSWGNDLIDPACGDLVGHEAAIALFCQCPANEGTYLQLHVSILPNCEMISNSPPFYCVPGQDFLVEWNAELVCTTSCDAEHPCACSSGGGDFSYLVLVQNYLP